MINLIFLKKFILAYVQNKKLKKNLLKIFYLISDIKKILIIFLDKS